MLDRLRARLFPRPGDAEELAATVERIREQAQRIDRDAAQLLRLRSAQAEVLASGFRED